MKIMWEAQLRLIAYWTNAGNPPHLACESGLWEIAGPNYLVPLPLRAGWTRCTAARLMCAAALLAALALAAAQTPAPGLVLPGSASGEPDHQIHCRCLHTAHCTVLARVPCPACSTAACPWLLLPRAMCCQVGGPASQVSCTGCQLTQGAFAPQPTPYLIQCCSSHQTNLSAVALT
jgi:hypothetical protein